jgi:hypothetical protein
MRATQFVKTELAENYPKHQDLSGISTEKLKAYLARQGQQAVPGEGSQVKRVQAELQRRSQGVAEGSTDTVMFEIDSENAYNHVMKQFGSVVGWDGDTMVAPRKYWGSIQELAYSAGGEATEVGNEQGVAEGTSRPASSPQAPTAQAWRDAAKTAKNEGVGGTVAGAVGGGILGALVGHPWAGTVLGAWLGAWLSKTNNSSDARTAGQHYLVYVNGKNIDPRYQVKSTFGDADYDLNYDEVDGGGFTKEQAVEAIVAAAEKEHDRKTQYTIVNAETGQVVFRKYWSDHDEPGWQDVEHEENIPVKRIPTQRIEPSMDEQGVAEGNYDRDDYYNARQGREYGKGLTATGWGGDGSKTRRDDIFKGQSKRLPADPFARTSGAVPTAGTGRIHSNALPGEMDEANDQKIGGRHDADDFDDMVARLKKLAGSGPMRTVYDPDRRVYRNMPTAQQPAQQPKKAPR